MELTQNLVKRLYWYRNGDLFRKETLAKQSKINELVGSPCRGGYLMTSINYRLYAVHRLIFLYHHGHLPAMLDHKDGDILNNKIENLRECDYSKNNSNRKINTNNTSGVKGVFWYKKYGKWCAKIGKNKKRHFLGYYDSKTEAADVVARARKKLHGEFANDGYGK